MTQSVAMMRRNGEGTTQLGDLLLSDIERALRALDEPVLESLRRQLTWCRDYVSGDREPGVRPGPFSMGLIATRELDMYGDQQELAGLINSVESRVNARMSARPTF